MQLNQVTRVFLYNGVTLPDPGPSLTAEAVKDVFTGVYPELVSAAIEGPVMKGGKQTFTFIKAVRDKGAREAEKWVEQLMAVYQGSTAQAEPGVQIDVGCLSDEELKCGAHLERLFGRQEQRTAQACMVAEALPLLL
jgi:PRTRC genetic system protein C